MRREGHRVGRLDIICMCVANKIYLEALPEALPCSIAEVACGCKVPAECACPEAFRVGRGRPSETSSQAGDVVYQEDEEWAMGLDRMTGKLDELESMKTLSLLSVCPCCLHDPTYRRRPA
jgi:hypothetical protein